MMNTSTSRSVQVACEGATKVNIRNKTAKSKMKAKWNDPILMKDFIEQEHWHNTLKNQWPSDIFRSIQK